MTNRLPHCAARSRVHTSRGLIDEDDLRATDHGHRQSELALITTTQAARLRVSESTNSKALHRGAHVRFENIVGNTNETADEVDGLSHSENIIKCVRLWTIANQTMEHVGL